MPVKSGSVIYSPPREGLPHLLVTVADGEITAFTPVASHDEARVILGQETARKRGIVQEAPRP